MDSETIETKNSPVIRISSDCSRHDDTPGKALMQAILVCTIKDLESNDDRRIKALRWVRSNYDSRNTPSEKLQYLSFIEVCSILGYNPDKIREKLEEKYGD